MKKFRITNKKKFIRSMSIMFLIIIGIILLFSKSSLSHNEHTSYDTIIVVRGDTLWQIALDQQKNNPYYENKDVRDIIQNIKNINELTNSGLMVGQELKIPTI